MKKLLCLWAWVILVGCLSEKQKPPCNYKDNWLAGGGEYFWRIYRVSSNCNRTTLVNTINSSTRHEGIWQIHEMKFTVTGTVYSVVNDPLYYVVFKREPL